MQIKNWDDLRYLLALERAGTLSGAARLLGVDDTTVSRRLANLQRASSAPLYHRQPDGRLQLTDEGEAAAASAERIEHQIGQVEEIFGAELQSCSGLVRITSVPVVINHLLTPRVAALISAHPLLQVELIPESKDLNLSRREADLAIRLARPMAGGSLIKTRKIGELHCGVYTLGKPTAKQLSALPWIGYDDDFAHLAPQQWMKRRVAAGDGVMSGLRVRDVETALQAVLAGLGRTVLPDLLAAQDRRLRSLPVAGVAPPPRELWLLSHTSQAKLRRIAEVMRWIDQIFANDSGKGQ